MPLFKYRGYDPSGVKVDGEMSANTIEDVERRIAAQAVTIISIIPAGASRTASSGGDVSAPRGRKKVSDGDIAKILQDLAVMAETGVPFVEALDAVIETARTPTIQGGLIKFKAEVVGGKGLSAAMRAANGIFPGIVCDMVRIAETGGRLDKALISAAIYVERAADFRRKIMNAMLYPIVLTCIATGTVVILLTFVMPRFADIFKKMNAAIPQSTMFMLGLGSFLKTHPIQILAGLIAAFFAIRAVLRTPAANRAFAAFLLRVPILGELLRRLALARAFQSIATLLGTNISMLAALEHGAAVSGNPIIRDALLQCRVSVEHGSPLSDSLKETKVFPPMLVQMVTVGERTGRLASLMQNTAGHMETEVDSRLKALISIVEPLMIVVMGCVVGAITMSIIIPMYSVVQNVR